MAPGGCSYHRWCLVGGCASEQTDIVLFWFLPPSLLAKTAAHPMCLSFGHFIAVSVGSARSHSPNHANECVFIIGDYTTTFFNPVWGVQEIISRITILIE